MRPPPRAHDRVEQVTRLYRGKGEKLGHLQDQLQPIVHIRQAEDEETIQSPPSLVWRRSQSSGSDDEYDEERWGQEEDEEDREDDGMDVQEIRRRCQLRRASEISWGESQRSSAAGDLPTSTSPLPSLSPSRPRLFEDDSDDEDEDQVLILRTPSEASSLSKSPSLSRRSPNRKPAATDPLLSPAPSSPVLAHGFGRRHQGWLPTPSRVEKRRLSTSSPLGDLLPPASPASNQPSISLLTQSLRSLARLPNLSIDALPASQPPPLGTSSALSLEGLGEVIEETPWEWKGSRLVDVAAVDEAWEVPRPSAELIVGIQRSPMLRQVPPALVDNEHAAVVQLQTFSSPAPASPPRRTIDLPPPLPLVVEPEDEPAALPPVVTTRYISNPRHLLMISLELAMMRADKIRSPLRPRAVVVRCGGVKGQGLGHSALQHEVV